MNSWHDDCSVAIMSHQAKGAAIGIAFVLAFIASVAMHSLVLSLIVLLTTLTVAYVVGIAWMRTSRNAPKRPEIR